MLKSFNPIPESEIRIPHFLRLQPNKVTQHIPGGYGSPLQQMLAMEMSAVELAIGEYAFGHVVSGVSEVSLSSNPLYAW